MPVVTIDGRQLEFSPGESIIQVATRHGVEIPYYCWHPRLSIAANCRMCLVEVEKAPKLLPACQTECREGMVVHTETKSVKDTQRAVHEFLLINHPIDCPICDQAGECKLQNYYMKHQLGPSRMQDAKVHKPRHEQLGPYVIYNAERCIMCTRCVRFMDEIAGERQLGIFNRGDHAEIGTFEGQPLDSAYSLNTVDVCPVGALTSSVFRFKQRVWNLSRSPSLCGGCARGCNVHVDFRSRQVYRLLPRENDEVNQSWLCDEGRLTYRRANDERLTHALMKDGGVTRTTERKVALERTVELLQPLRGKGDGIALALTLHTTVEEAYVAARFAKDGLGVRRVTLLGYDDGVADKLLRLADRNPNRAGIERVLKDLGLAVGAPAALVGELGRGSVKALVVVGAEADGLATLAQAAARLEVFVHIAHATSPLSEVAHVTLPSVAWVQRDGTWVNAQGMSQCLVPAYDGEDDAQASHAWLVELCGALGVDVGHGAPQSLRATIERTLPSFAQSRLTELGA
ncbi:MAG: 2Fe-2S iron-sulfur cluster-binding protein [Myxococcota bacterium]